MSLSEGDMQELVFLGTLKMLPRLSQRRQTDMGPWCPKRTQLTVDHLTCWAGGGKQHTLILFETIHPQAPSCRDGA